MAIIMIMIMIMIMIIMIMIIIIRSNNKVHCHGPSHGEEVDLRPFACTSTRTRTVEYSKVSLSVSDFQGFESYRPSANEGKPNPKPKNLPSLPFPHHHHIIIITTTTTTIIPSELLPCCRWSLTASTLLLLVLLCYFCQLDTATPFGSRLIHSFSYPSFNTATFSTNTTTFLATADIDTTPSLLCAGPASTHWYRR